MSDVVSVTDFRPREIRHAKCSNCGKVACASVPAFRSKEIRLWWPAPLAVIIWLAIIWKFGYFLTSPNVKMVPPAPIEASFVELPEGAPNLQTKRSEVQSKRLPKQTKIISRPDTSHRTDIAASKPVTPIAPVSVSNLAPPTDLMAYVNAARERSRAAEIAAEHENAEASAKARGPSADEIRMANIRRNLQPEGTNGVFQIVSMGVRTAKFSFRGWTKDFSNARSELIEVDAGPNGDVERAIVRSMIELIRKYYKGDFNWESQRLDREVILSARMEDNAGLEDFLMREFFGVHAK